MFSVRSMPDASQEHNFSTDTKVLALQSFLFACFIGGYDRYIRYISASLIRCNMAYTLVAVY